MISKKLKPFISYLKVDGPTEYTRVKIVPMTTTLAEIWHRYVQPIIHTHYSDGKVSNPKPIRADYKWNWHNIIQLNKIHNIGHFNALAAPAQGFCLTINLDNEDYPIGMLTLVPQYLCKAEKFGRKTYVWYLSTAPKEFYDTYTYKEEVKGVGKALLDTAIQASIKYDGDGALLLHSSPKGGEELKQYYLSCTFKPVPESSIPLTFYRWRDRGGYFALSKINARNFSDKNDIWRHVQHPASLPLQDSHIMC